MEKAGKQGFPGEFPHLQISRSSVVELSPKNLPEMGEITLVKFQEIKRSFGL